MSYYVPIVIPSAGAGILMKICSHLKPESPYKRKGAEPKFSLSSTQAAFVFLSQKSKQHEQHMDLFGNMHMSRRGMVWAS